MRHCTRLWIAMAVFTLTVALLSLYFAPTLTAPHQDGQMVEDMAMDGMPREEFAAMSMAVREIEPVRQGRMRMASNKMRDSGEQPSAKIQRTGSMSASCPPHTIDPLFASIKRSLSAVDGRVTYSNIYQQAADLRGAQLTLAVPADAYAAFSITLHSILNASFGVVITAEEESETDVTAQFVDQTSRMDIQAQAHAKLGTLLDKATRVSDILEIQREATRLEEQMTSLQRQHALLASRVAMVTLSLSLTEKHPEQSRAAKPPQSTAEEALLFVSRAWKWLARFVVRFSIIFALIVLPLAAAAIVVLPVCKLCARQMPHFAAWA